ncbi:MAG: hypothetical protein GWN62_34795, partial [Aliifodinibius sp.]|nr:hypothetical protein [Fodinibius sp.]
MKDFSHIIGQVQDQGTIPGYLHQYLDPYITGGPQMRQTLQQQFGRMIGDPGQFMAGMGAG